jgi:L-lactate dehydrogenase complex protein LldG
VSAVVIQSAKSAVLQRIRSAQGGGADLNAAMSAWAQLPRSYNRGSSVEAGSKLRKLTDRLADYDAHVEQCARDETPAAVGRALHACGARRVLVPSGLDFGLPCSFDRVEDSALAASELDRADAVVTRCTVAIAETGTLVLQTVPGQGRRALSLVPDAHVCVVRVGDVVMTVPEAFDRLAPTSTLPTTFVSGPSATADIEMTRIKGVHGPRTLYVVLEE